MTALGSGDARACGDARLASPTARPAHPAAPRPDDWVGEIVDGTGDPLGFGIDWTECGVVKFLRAQIVDELTPWLCASTTSPPRPPR